MTGGCYFYYELKWGKYLRVDGSARFRCYALTDGRDVTVYRKGEEVFRFSLSAGLSKYPHHSTCKLNCRHL